MRHETQRDDPRAFPEDWELAYTPLEEADLPPLQEGEEEAWCAVPSGRGELDFSRDAEEGWRGWTVKGAER